MSDTVPIHPVAPRLKNGPKKPHVGPTLDNYKALHAQSIGPGSDEYWSKVGQLNTPLKNYYRSTVTSYLKRSLARRFTGTDPSRPFGLVALKRAISSGFPKER